MIFSDIPLVSLEILLLERLIQNNADQAQLIKIIKMQNVKFVSDDESSISSHTSLRKIPTIDHEESKANPLIQMEDENASDYEKELENLEQKLSENENEVEEEIARVVPQETLLRATSSVNKDPGELEEIVKIFAHDLQQSIRQRFKNKQQQTKESLPGGKVVQQAKKVPIEIQKLLGEANTLYAFEKFQEAIKILEDVITRAPELTEPLTTLSSIYEEIGDLNKSLKFGAMAAFLLKTDIERWKHCATQAKSLRRYPDAIYCLNRAIKQSSKSDADDFLNLKYEKIMIYKLQNDFSSCVRMLLKLIQKFQSDPERLINLNITLAQIYKEQGLPLKGVEQIETNVLDILVSQDMEIRLLDMSILIGDLCIAAGSSQYFLEFLHERQIFEKDYADLNLEILVRILEVQVRKIIGQINLKELAPQHAVEHLREQVTLVKKTINPQKDMPVYLRLMQALMLIANHLENTTRDYRSSLNIYQLMFDIAIPMDKPQITLKLGQLTLNLGEIQAARKHLEYAFKTSPIQLNYEIRLALCDVYKQLRMPEKALMIIQNPIPDEKMFNDDQSTPLKGIGKRGRTQKQKSEIVKVGSSEEESSDEERKDERSVLSASSIQSPNKGHGMYADTLYNDKDYFLKRTDRVQKRTKNKRLREHALGEVPEVKKDRDEEIRQIKQNLDEFNLPSVMMGFEQARIHSQLGQHEQFLQVTRNLIPLIFENLYSKQCLQDILIQLKDEMSTTNKESLFMRKDNTSALMDDQTSLLSFGVISKMTHNLKVRLIEEINLYPTILSKVGPEEILWVCIETLEGVLSGQEYTLAKSIIEQTLKIELILNILKEQFEIARRFYKLAALIYFHQGLHLKAYKFLRKALTKEDMNNWALMGCILEHIEDSGLYRAYFQRIFKKPSMRESPLIMMILGNNFIQKQQFDSANEHMWLVAKCFENGHVISTHAYLNLVLAVVSLCQSFQRTNEQKEASVKRALAFMLRYSQTGTDQVEIHYNVARALHFLGLASNAMELYEKVIESTEGDRVSVAHQEIRVRAVFNLAQIMKGSGHGTPQNQELFSNIYIYQEYNQVYTILIIKLAHHIIYIKSIILMIIGIGDWCSNARRARS